MRKLQLVKPPDFVIARWCALDRLDACNRLLRATVPEALIFSLHKKNGLKLVSLVKWRIISNISWFANWNFHNWELCKADSMFVALQTVAETELLSCACFEHLFVEKRKNTQSWSSTLRRAQNFHSCGRQPATSNF